VKIKIWAIVLLVAGFSFLLPSFQANATWVQYARSPIDTYNRTDLPVAYDLTQVDFATDDVQTDKYFFFLQFSNPITANQFSDGKDSWAAVFLDIDNDGKMDYSLQTDGNVPYVGSVGHPYRFVDRTGSSPIQTSKCSGNTWTNLDTKVSWIGFNISKNCLNFASSIGITGYVDHISNDSAEFDYAPESPWILNLASGIISSSGTGAAGSSAVLPTFSSGLDVSLSSPSNQPADLVDLSARVGESVVTVLCSNGLGSGWSINVELPASMKSDGYSSYIITNHHVIEECTNNRNIQVVLKNQTKVSAYVWAWDATNDVAAVVTRTAVNPLNWRGATPQQGWWVGVIGSPLGFPGILTTGIVSSNNSISFLGTTTAPINHGNSGGPVFDRNGRVVGLATAKYVDSEGFGIFHGTPLLCGKIVKCVSTNEIWTGPISSPTPTPSPTTSTNSSPLALNAINTYNALIEKSNEYLTLQEECADVGGDLDDVATQIINSTLMHDSCYNEEGNIRDYADKAKNLFENTTVKTDQDFRDITSRFQVLTDQISTSGKKIKNSISTLTEALESFQELARIYSGAISSLELTQQKWDAFEEKLDWMPAVTQKAIKSSQAYKAATKQQDSMFATKVKLDTLFTNYAQIDTSTRLKTAITTTKLALKVDYVSPLQKSLISLEKLIPKFVCYSDEKVLVLPKSGKCPTGTTKTSTSR
jgi:S1-C subfamily serine protease